MTDPISQLLSDLRTHGKPSLEWVTRWSEGGRDPVRAAWEASDMPMAMEFLLFGNRNGTWPWTPAYQRMKMTLPLRMFICDPRRIREAFPAPPTLAQLLEAMEKRT